MYKSSSVKIVVLSTVENENTARMKCAPHHRRLNTINHDLTELINVCFLPSLMNLIADVNRGMT